MMILITTISILAIACFSLAINRLLPFKICPICAGVSGTWIWMLTLKFLGYEINLAILSMLMGGSVVGIAYQIEKKLAGGFYGWRTPILWKIFFIPVGFVAVYGILEELWIVFSLAVLFLVLVATFFVLPREISGQSKAKIDELKEKMKSCC